MSDQQLHVALGALGVAQGVGIFLLSIFLGRFNKLYDAFGNHLVDPRAHGNGMPRGEVEAHLQDVAHQLETIEETLKVWRAEYREDLREVKEKLNASR